MSDDAHINGADKRIGEDGDLATVLGRLLLATKSNEVVSAVEVLVNTFGGQWRSLGDQDSNYATVNISGDPKSSIIERVTNAIDATIERIAVEHSELISCSSPREFVEKALNIPDGYLGKLEMAGRVKLTDELGIVVKTIDGDSSNTPTIEIMDNGIGIKAEEFKDTIVSLHKGNKIKKWYLMGRFGQGGSTTLRFSNWTIIASKADGPGEIPIAVTVVRYFPAEKDERMGKYCYLVEANGLPFKVDSIDGFTQGTVVRHINYELMKEPTFIKIYGLLEERLFDPVLPFRYEEARDSSNKGEVRRISGARSRFATTKYLEYSDEYQVPVIPAKDGTITVRCWLLKAEADSSVMKTFVDPSYPIVITYLGQTQDVLPRGLIGSECKLGYLDRHLVVQVDCESLTDEGRRNFFTSTRERITIEGKEIVTNAVIKILKEDEDLRGINEQRKMDMVQKATGKNTEEMRQKLAEMINRIRPGTFKTATSTTTMPTGTSRQRSPTGRKAQPPLPTKDFPTFIKIANHEDPIDFTKGEPRRIVVHSDAPDGFLDSQMFQASIQVTSDEPGKVSLLSRHKDFKGGRLHISAIVSDSMAEEEQFEIVLRLEATTVNGVKIVLEDRRPCIVAKTEAPEPTGTSGGVDAPRIIPVTEGDYNWTTLQFNRKTVAEVVESSSGIDIFVSLANEWYAGALSKATSEQAWVERLKNQYLLNIAFNAYLQNIKLREGKWTVSEDDLEAIKQEWLETSARTVLTIITSEKTFEPE